MFSQQKMKIYAIKIQLKKLQRRLSTEHKAIFLPLSSTQGVAQNLDMPFSMLWKILWKIIQFYPYKMSIYTRVTSYNHDKWLTFVLPFFFLPELMWMMLSHGKSYRKMRPTFTWMELYPDLLSLGLQINKCIQRNSCIFTKGNCFVWFHSKNNHRSILLWKYFSDRIGNLFLYRN